MYSYANLLYGLKYKDSEVNENQRQQVKQNPDLIVIDYYDDEIEPHYFIGFAPLVFSSESDPFFEKISPSDLQDISAGEKAINQAIEDYQLLAQEPAWHLYSDQT